MHDCLAMHLVLDAQDIAVQLGRAHNNCMTPLQCPGTMIDDVGKTKTYCFRAVRQQEFGTHTTSRLDSIPAANGHSNTSLVGATGLCGSPDIPQNCTVCAPWQERPHRRLVRQQPGAVGGGPTKWMVTASGWWLTDNGWPLTAGSWPVTRPLARVFLNRKRHKTVGVLRERPAAMCWPLEPSEPHRPAASVLSASNGKVPTPAPLPLFIQNINKMQGNCGLAGWPVA